MYSPFPEILFIIWFAPFDSISKVVNCFFLCLCGIWACLACAVLFCTRIAGTWPERKPSLLCLCWFIYLFHFSVAFWIDGYSVRSVVYVFLPALAAIAMTVLLLAQAIFNKKLSRKKSQILLLALAIPAEIVAFLLMYYSVDSSAFGASC